LLTLLAKELMILRAFCVLIALSMSALSPVLANAAHADQEISQSSYSLPDGSSPIICFGNGDDLHEDSNHCDECLLSSNFLDHHSYTEDVSAFLSVEIGLLPKKSHRVKQPEFLQLNKSRAPPLV